MEILGFFIAYYIFSKRTERKETKMHPEPARPPPRQHNSTRQQKTIEKRIYK